MASITINGDTSGGITLSAPAVAGSNTQTLAAVAGTLAPIVSGTSQASTSGTSIDFTGIPSWAKRITVLLKGVSLSGTDDLLIQIGSGSVVSTGYVSTSNGVSNASTTSAASSTSGFIIRTNNASNVVSGVVTIAIASSSFDYVSSHSVKNSTTNSAFGGGDVTLSSSADRVRITTTGTNTFDAGTINILYE